MPQVRFTYPGKGVAVIASGRLRGRGKSHIRKLSPCALRRLAADNG